LVVAVGIIAMTCLVGCIRLIPRCGTLASNRVAELQVNRGFGE